MTPLWPLLLLCLILTACAEEELRFSAEKGVPIAAPAAASEAALVRPAERRDILGAWQVLALPVELRQDRAAEGRFAAPWQWYLFLADGRVGQIASDRAPLGAVTAGAVRAELRRSPRFDAFAIQNGKLRIEPLVLSGYSFLGRQAWRTSVVVKSGRALGIDVAPDDLVMTLIDASGRVLHHRALRHLPE